MNFSRSQLIIIGIGGLLVLLILLLLFTGIGRNPTAQKANLVFWGTEDRAYFDDALASFQNKYKNVQIKYTRIDEASYEDQLVDALAAGTGPDVFMFGSRWLPRHYNKVSPAPAEKLSGSKFADLFPQIARENFVSDGQVFASPLYIDTPVLFYNRDIFDRLSISLPPRTWDDFKGLVSIKKASAAFGGYAPLISRAGDIMEALLMQAGADLDLQNKNFIRISSSQGIKALSYYIQFAAPREDAITGFAGERIAMIIGYHSDKVLIKNKNPFINLGVAALPQFYVDSPVVPARYYGLAVSAKSNSKDAAWDLVSYITTDPDVAESLYLKGAHPPALRSLIQKYSDDSDIGVFARQALIARSWFEPNDREVTSIFNNMIKSALSDRNVSSALQAAEAQINKIITQ